MERNESRGARGVEDQRRAAEIQEIAQPCGEHSIVLRGQLAGAVVAAQLQQRVIALLGSYKHAYPEGAQLFRSKARVLQRVPGFLQQQPLTRVHSGGFAGRDRKEQRIELGDSIQQGRGPGLRFGSGGLPLGAGAARSPVCKVGFRHGPDCAATLSEDPPQLCYRPRPGESTAHSDNGDRLLRLPRWRSVGRRYR